ncbi:MAG: DUF2330 domain-containing protein [Deltaproteobacteria bacterium]|nr:DUF2330 domain-containing protein [Deltaproteobacteria bacterium]
MAGQWVRGALSGFLVVLGVLLTPSEAPGCGGCFAPPSAAQVVTDHRMVLSLSTRQSTLWDQFQYTGRPEDFSWILPVRYTDATRVQLASDDFLQLLTNLLVPALQPPSPPPLEPGCTFPPPAPEGRADASFPQDAPPPPDSGVTVLREEVVGPYAVAIVRGTTGMGLRTWLRMNGYAVPAAVEPVIDHYLGLSMDFIALRLRPGEGLQRMVPVRVTLEGYQPRLPLRMIAAGVADRVGLSLTVFADARIEAMNFPNAQLSDDDFTWDWSRPPGPLGELFVSAFNARNRAAGQRLWLTEAAQLQERAALTNLARFFPPRAGFAGPDAGMSASTAVDDVGVAFEGLRNPAMVTRLRADLPGAMLDRDLELAASDLGERPRTYGFGHELNRPVFSRCPFPIFDAGAQDVVPATDLGRPPPGGDASDAGDAADGAAPALAATGGCAQCSTTPVRRLPGGPLMLACAVATALRSRRRRAASRRSQAQHP